MFGKVSVFIGPNWDSCVALAASVPRIQCPFHSKSKDSSIEAGRVPEKKKKQRVKFVFVLKKVFGWSRGTGQSHVKISLRGSVSCSLLQLSSMYWDVLY